jgi:hypothetical protein
MYRDMNLVESTKCELLIIAVYSGYFNGTWRGGGFDNIDSTKNRSLLARSEFISV